MEKAYKFRLYPAKAQQQLMLKTFGCTRFVYNQTLAARRDAYTIGKASFSGNDCVKFLPGLKEQYPWLREVILRLCSLQAYQNFFRGLKGMHKKKASFPKFKAKHHCRNSFTSKMNLAVGDRAVRLPKLGWVKAKVSYSRAREDTLYNGQYEPQR